MTDKHGSSLTKPRERASISSIFSNEASGHLLAFSFAALFSEIYLLYNEDADHALISLFPFLVTGIFLMCCILENIFSRFVSGAVSIVFSIIPSLVLAFMLRRFNVLLVLQSAIIMAVLLRLCLSPILRKWQLLITVILLLDIAALYLFFSEDAFSNHFLSEKLFCISLVILTLYAGQAVLFPKERSLFPIHFFLCVGILASLISMKKTPIDWSFAVRLGQKIAEGIETAADNTSYYFSSAFGSTYSTGYSSLSANGGKIERSDRLQIILETDEMPYRTYQDEETGEFENVRKTLYLSGGIGSDTTQFVSFLGFLNQNGIDKDTAALFTQPSAVDIEYVYLDTHDEIAPRSAFLLTRWDQKITGGVSTSLHKKGYRISAQYLDIDYASPYLTHLLRSGKGASALNYEDACAYAKDLWDIELSEVLSADEYEKALAGQAKTGSDIRKEYLDITGTDNRLLSLADEITSGCSSDYDKCKQIESFLRQYAYSTDSEGGYDESSDMSSSKGMADISERFLFDTGKGYCVHFTSSMVMLLRLSGIPARAVTGYRYAFPFEKNDEYRINAKCAHAWPEAYIDGAGWIPFEPTPAYYTQADSSWHKAPALLEKAEESPVKDVPKAYVQPQNEPSPEDSFAQNSLLALKVLWPFILSAILLVVLLIAGTRLLKYLRYKYASPTRQLLFDVEQIKRSLVKSSGLQIYDRGHLSDYVPLAPDDMQSDLTDIFGTCYRLMYSAGKDNAPTPAENALARSIREKLEKNKSH